MFTKISLNQIYAPHFSPSRLGYASYLKELVYAIVHRMGFYLTGSSHEMGVLLNRTIAKVNASEDVSQTRIWGVFLRAIAAKCQEIHPGISDQEIGQLVTEALRGKGGAPFRRHSIQRDKWQQVEQQIAHHFHYVEGNTLHIAAAVGIVATGLLYLVYQEVPALPVVSVVSLISGSKYPTPVSLKDWDNRVCIDPRQDTPSVMWKGLEVAGGAMMQALGGSLRLLGSWGWTIGAVGGEKIGQGLKWWLFRYSLSDRLEWLLYGPLSEKVMRVNRWLLIEWLVHLVDTRYTWVPVEGRKLNPYLIPRKELIYGEIVYAVLLMRGW